MRWYYLFLPAALATSAHAQTKIYVDWKKAELLSRTTPTLQVVVNPPLRRGGSLHDSAFHALQMLGADYVRFVPWMPYPRLAVAELEPPGRASVSWDFHLIDPLVTDFLDATEGHSVVLNFSTIPEWMFRTDSPVRYPENPDSVVWDYSQGNVLRDTTMKELSGYYARLYAWYAKGGFTDELGHFHRSGYHYHIPYWEVTNEPDLEHNPSPAQYTREYDAIVRAIRKESPDTRFVGMSLAFETNPDWYAYFLDHRHHAPGIPLDMISYHFYATSTEGQTIDDMQYTYFERADGFLNMVRYIENLRKTLSPETKTTIDEAGSIYHNEDSIPPGYWNLSAALYAYLYLHLTRIGIDVVGESQLVGYPTQYPSVSMMDWTNGRPNARYWVLKLVHDNFGPGDSLYRTWADNNRGDAIVAQGFLTRAGKRLLLINKRNRAVTLQLPSEFAAGKVAVVDEKTDDEPPRGEAPTGGVVTLGPFAVAVASAP